MQKSNIKESDFDKGDLIAPKEAAEIMCISRSQIYFFIHNGLLKTYKLGRQHRILKSDLMEFIRINEYQAII